MLKSAFIQLLFRHSDHKNLIKELWTEIETNYSDKNRHYHTLLHLENLLTQLTEVKSQIKNWDTLLFSLFYHDAIYNAKKSDNEEKSAELAEKRMKELRVPTEMIELCKSQIMATKSHISSGDSDTNYFTDADLSVLGMDWESYTQYYKGVRKEYAIYPTLIYNPGRKKVLNHFLSMERIYKTDHFYHKFEEQAKENLKKELEIL